MIDLIPDEDQQALLDSFTSFLGQEAAVSSAVVEDIWERIAALGWLGLARSEDAGGAGLGTAEEMLLLRECGRYLVTPSLMASLIAVRIADAVAQETLAADIASGARRVALAMPRDADTLYAIDAARADLLLVIGAEGVTLHPRQEPGSALLSSDSRVTLSLVPASAPQYEAAGAVHARLMVAAQLTGIAEAVRDMATGYAKLRTQFGQPIGAFQAVKHGCADLAIRAEAALAQTSYAALCLAVGSVDAEAQVAAAVRVAGDAARTGAEANIQLHGAMGFTEECHAHLYLKRAHLLSLFDGRAHWQANALLAS